MSPKERLALIRRIARVAYVETESWESEDHLGSHLAYLMWAISVCDERSHVNWSTSSHEAVLALFRRWFPDTDPVWQFIKT